MLGNVRKSLYDGVEYKGVFFYVYFFILSEAIKVFFWWAPNLFIIRLLGVYVVRDILECGAYKNLLFNPDMNIS